MFKAVLKKAVDGIQHKPFEKRFKVLKVELFFIFASAAKIQFKMINLYYICILCVWQGFDIKRPDIRGYPVKKQRFYCDYAVGECSKL